MAGDGGRFAVEFDDVSRIAGQLTEVIDALAAAVDGAADVDAVASPGFTSVDAALSCASAWLAEVRRLAGRVDTARVELADSVTTYRDTDGSADGSFQAVHAGTDAGIGG